MNTPPVDIPRLSLLSTRLHEQHIATIGVAVGFDLDTSGVFDKVFSVKHVSELQLKTHHVSYAICSSDEESF